jgi:D-Tyr-tRNAtyr deacylase
MEAVLEAVTRTAQSSIYGEIVARMDSGLLAFICVAAGAAVCLFLSWLGDKHAKAEAAEAAALAAV